MPPLPPPLTPVICGPTAGGKTELALTLSRLTHERLNLQAEIVTADAFQVYRGMDIGTAKPTPDQRRAVPHHLIDLVEPDVPDPFTVQHWLALAQAAIADIRARGRLPIVVGGTHLSIKSLLEGLFKGPRPDPVLRAELAAMPPEDRRAELERVDPEAAARIHPSDIRRAVRALEVFRLTGTPISTLQTQWDRPDVPVLQQPAYLLIPLSWPTEDLNQRINARVRGMMEAGFLDEVRRLAPRLGPQAREALGYKQLLEHLAGRSSLNDAVEQTKIQTRRFAKNQRTWLRRLGTTPGALPLVMPAPVEEAAERVLARLQCQSKT